MRKGIDDMILLTLIHYIEQAFGMSVQDRQDRVFSNRVKAEEWLRQNGFSYRRRIFLEGDPLEWCHEKEEAWDFIDVHINEYKVDDETPFQFEPIEAPWRAAARRDGFIETRGSNKRRNGSDSPAATGSSDLHGDR